MARQLKRLTQPVRGWALYLRTSSEEAQNPKLSFDRQLYAIEGGLLTPSQLPTIETYSDLETGRNRNRKGYQMLLSDARAGKFSLVAVERPDRFGRDDTEALRAIDELNEFGVAVRFSNMPDIDPIDPDGRVIVVLSFTLARRESMLMGARIKGGLLAKMRQGGCATLAPDGYKNMEERTEREDKLQHGRHKHWIEPDLEQSKVWRKAWDLLLEDKLTLEEICEELHTYGYRFRTGRPFVEVKNGKRKAAINGLSKKFHNWFYAGWVVSEKFSIPPKTIQGTWTPLVSTDEFEKGLQILGARLKSKAPKRKHDYLLSQLAYIQIPGENDLTRLTCSTSNPVRSGGGTSYYRVVGTEINFRCGDIDTQVSQHLRSIRVEPDLIPSIRKAYTNEIADKLGHLQPSDEEKLKKALKDIDDKEARSLRIYASGKITEAVWNSLWEEWQDQRRNLRNALDTVSQKAEYHIAHLDDALTIITQIGVLFGRMSLKSQKELLHEVVEKVVISLEGEVTHLELRPPFGYLSDMLQQMGRMDGNEDGQTKTTSISGGQCSNQISSVGPEGKSSVN